MKLENIAGGSYDQTVHGRKERMAALLSLWERPRYWERTDARPRRAQDDPNHQLTAAERLVWPDMLRRADGVPPRTHVPGFMRLLSLLASTQPFSELVDQGVVVRVCNRVAFSSGRRGRPGGSPLPTAQSWGLFVPGTVDDDTHLLLEKKFQNVQDVSEGFVCHSPWTEQAWDDLGALLELAASADTDDDVLNAWYRARALRVNEQLLTSATQTYRDRLSTLLANALLDNRQFLNSEADLILASHQEGVAYTMVEERGLECRLNALHRAGAQIGHIHRGFDNEYFEDAAHDFALVATPTAIGNLLTELPAGAVLAQAFETLVSVRPRVLAELLWHPAWRVEAAHCLFRLPRQFTDERYRVDLTEEWLELQRLSRLQFFGDGRSSIVDAIALSVRDEERHELAQRGIIRSWQEPALTAEASFVGWTEWITEDASDDAAAKAVVDALSSPNQPTEGMFAFALRMMRFIAGRNEDLAKPILATVLERYTQAFSPVGGVHVPDLARLGVVLGAVAILLRRDPELWRRWRAPLDLEAAFESVRTEELPSRISSGEYHATFRIPERLHAHVRNLLAMAEFCDDDTAGELLTTALDVYVADRGSFAPFSVFGWSLQTAERTSQGEEPLFVVLGRRLGSSTRRDEFLRRLLRNRPDVLNLAWLLIGAEAVPEVRPLLVDHVRDLVAERDEDEIRLGEASAITNALWLAKLPAEMEVYARVMSGIARSRTGGALQGYQDAATAAIAASLNQQHRWQDVLQLEIPKDWEQETRVRNARAIAYINMEQPDDAGEELRQILKRDRRNAQALANKIVIEARAQRWENVLRMSGEARALLGEDTPSEVITLEQSAIEQISSPQLPLLATAQATPITDPLIGTDDAIVKEVFAKASKSIALIRSAKEKGMGTGFMVQPGVLMTAKHLLEGIDSPVVEFLHDSATVVIDAIEHVRNLDVSLLRVHIERPEGTPPPLAIASSVEPLDPILILGFPRVPLSVEPIIVPMRGDTHGITTTVFGEELLIISPITRGGCSGAPILNSAGEVVGLVAQALFERPEEGDHVAEGLGFSAAVPLSALRRCLEEAARAPEPTMEAT